MPDKWRVTLLLRNTSVGVGRGEDYLIEVHLKLKDDTGMITC